MPEREKLSVPIYVVFGDSYRTYEVPSVVCSFAGWDLVVGGEEGFDGGDVARDSLASKLAKALL